MNNIFKEHHKKHLQELCKGLTLYKHLILSGYLPDSWVLPPIIKITTKPSGIGDYEERSPVTLFAPKAKLRWRQFSFLHPNNYQKVCQLLCAPTFNTNLLALSNSTKIFSYTIPQRYRTPKENSEKQITRWVELQEDLLLCSGEYDYILILDISNCYHVMYTHAIEWAIKKVGSKKSGKNLDKAIRSGMDKRTHGIPVGSAPSHYIAEIVLSNVDRKIEKNSKVKDFIGGRYRDNYFLLCKSKAESELLLKEMIVILREHHMDFNSEKTKIVGFSDYFDSFWRIDFNTILAKLDIENITTITKLPIRKIEAFIGLSLRLSQEHRNDKAITDRLLDILEKIEPENDLYPKYFSLIQRIYNVRTQTLPKVFGLLNLLASKNYYCKKRFKSFLVSQLVSSYKSSNNFEMMWIIYFLTASNTKKTKEISRYIEKIKLLEDKFLNLVCVYYESSLSGTISSHGDLFADLWQKNPNLSSIQANFAPLPEAGDITEILKISFSTLGYGGGSGGY